MRMVPDPDGNQWRRLLREQARRDAEELVPRPGYPIYGLASPAVRPATLSASQRTDGEWTLITLRYGPWDSADGPFVAVTTESARPSRLVAAPAGRGRGTEAELRFAIEEESALAQGMHAASAGVVAGAADAGPEPGEPPVMTREALAFGDSVIMRSAAMWAARAVSAAEAGAAGTSARAPAGLIAPTVVVTVVGRGVDPRDVRLEPVTDLRPMLEGREAELGRIIERNRRLPRPDLPDLPPAEGVAALRALADATLRRHAAIREAAKAGRPARLPGDGGMHSALWQRAVREQQRLTGAHAQAADEAVTSAVNHLGHLLEQMPWFTGDERLREAAINETLAYVLLGDAVPSEPAQRAWRRYWSERTADAGRATGPDRLRARMTALKPLEAGWRAAWEAWASAA